MKMPPPTVENQNSSLLSTEENLQVFKLLGNRCQTISTTVVQLFVTSPPHHSQWLKKGTGVLCFVKDYSKKNYFFRMFSLKKNCLVWEHELYNNMEYVESTAFFHVFEGEEYIVAFNFASPPEAKHLKTIVDQKITMKKRKEEKKARQIAQSQSMRVPHKKNLDFGSKQEFRKEKRKRNITKADIGTPMDFVHISHVGWDPNTGFDVNSEDAELKALFQKAGVSEKELQDEETREFIYDFLHKHGGLETNYDNNRYPPAVPPRGTPRPPSARPAPPPPPVTRMPSQDYSAPRKARPPSPPKQNMSGGGGGGPAPPPPPPPPPMNMPMPPPMMDNGEERSVPAPPSMADGNSALMQSIRSGTTLKPVEDRSTTPVDDARGDLLSAIRKGIQLKPVDEREIKPAENPSPQRMGGNDLAGALRKALAERSNVLHSEDDDDDTSSTSNDEDWD